MFSLLNIRIGWFLAVRQVRRGSRYVTALIISVMVLTFLNLVVVSGILVGLIQGSINAWHTQYTSDIILSAPSTKNYIQNSQDLIALAHSLPEVAAVSARYGKGGSIEANYLTRRSADKPNTAGAQIYGIDPASEDAVTDLGTHLIKGAYLAPGDYDQVLIGYFLLTQYLTIQSPNFQSLDNVDVGSKIRLTLGGATREVTVKGILKSKVDNVRRGVFLIDSETRSMAGQSIDNAQEIAIRLRAGTDPDLVKQKFLAYGADQYAVVQTYTDAQPQALKDIVSTFAMLGNAFSSIGLVVASITMFIVVFINAITRRKFIGILKGIGIDGSAIEWSYVFQSTFYALCGSTIGLVLVYAFLVPYFAAHPIDFPFSDGILVAPYADTGLRIMLLVATTVIAGYVPARMIVQKNTLDSILGRN